MFRILFRFFLGEIVILSAFLPVRGGFSAQLSKDNLSRGWFSFWGVGPDSSKIDLAWEIRAPEEITFNLLRSQERDGKYEVINVKPIVGFGTAELGRWIFGYRDQDVAKNQEYFYKFQALTKESTWVLDTIVVARAKFVPTPEEKEELDHFKVLTSDMERITFDGQEKEGLSWSPDGKHIAYDGLDVNKEKESKWVIYIVNIGDKTVKGLVANNQDNIYPSWSGDGRTILFSSILFSSSPPWEVKSSISLLNLKNHRTKFIMKTHSDTTVVSLGCLSSDGGRIAFVRYNGHVNAPNNWVMSMGTAHIWTANVDGLQPKQITFGSSNEMQPKWSPNGKMIAFYRVKLVDQGSEGEHLEESLGVFSVNGGQIRQVVRDCTIEGFSWSPDSKWIAYGCGRPPVSHQIAVASLSDGESNVLLQGLTCGEPAWSPDGKRMALVIKDPLGDKKDIWLMDLPDSLWH